MSALSGESLAILSPAWESPVAVALVAALFGYALIDWFISRRRRQVRDRAAARLRHPSNAPALDDFTAHWYEAKRVTR